MASRLSTFSLSFVASVVARVIGLLQIVIVTPLALSYLGKEMFGVWNIIVSFVLMLNFSDLGLGNGLLNELIAAHAAESKAEVKKLVSSAFFLLLVTASTMLLLTQTGISLNDWGAFFKTDAATGSTVRWALTAAVVLFLCNVPLGIIQKIQYSYLQNSVFHSWETLQKVLSVGWVFLAIYMDWGLVGMVIGFFAPLMLLNSTNFINYARRRPEIVPEYNSFDSAAARRLLHTGAYFFGITLLSSLSRSTDAFFIGRFGSLAQVADYSIPTKPYEILMVGIMAVSSSSWPIFGDAIQKRDTLWLKRFFYRSLGVITVGLIVSCTFIVVFNDTIMHYWVGDKYHYDTFYLIGLALLIGTFALNNFVYSFLNGAGLLKIQLRLYILYFLFGLPTKIAMIHYYGLTAFVYSNVILFFLILFLPAIYRVVQYLKSMETME